MKSFYYFVMVLFVGLLLPSTSFTQSIIQAPSSENIVNPPLLPEHILDQSKNSSIQLRGDDDLLIASRYDVFFETNSWEYSDSAEFFYNAKSQLSSQLRLTWNGTKWLNGWKGTYGFDANGNLSTLIWNRWNGMEWEIIAQYLYEYNANNLQTLYQYQTWDGADWINYQQIISTFDNNNNIILLHYQNWNVSDWLSTIRIVYEYDQNNNELLEKAQSWEGTDWIDLEQAILGYDNDMNNISIEFQEMIANNWINTKRTLFDYDNNVRILEIRQIWRNKEWIDLRHIISEYDSNDNLILELYQNINSTGFANTWKTFYEYDINNNFIFYKLVSWVGNEWTDYSRYYYRYQLSTNNEEVNPLSNALQITPNPSNGIITLNLNAYPVQKGLINIFDTHGRNVHSQNIKEESNQSIDLRHLSNGTYFLQLVNEEELLTKKIMIVH